MKVVDKDEGGGQYNNIEVANRPVTVDIQQNYPSGSHHCACAKHVASVAIEIRDQFGAMAEMCSVDLSVGSSFTSFEKLEEQIKGYQEKKFVQLVKRDTRTLEMARKRVPKRVLGANTALVYYSLHYTCAFGGKKYKAEGTGQRRNLTTLKQGCQAGIKIKLSEDKQMLVVMEIEEDHNHLVEKEIFQHLPHQRKFDKSEKGKIEDLLKLKVNKKLLQQHISDATQKVVTLKDISNVQTGLRSTKDRNDISALVSKLEAMEGSTVEVFVEEDKAEEDKAFTGIFFQDRLMKLNFEFYPEVLMIDATYKLNELRMPLYLMMIVDSNGQSEIIATFLTVLETEKAITKMVQVFKTHNPNWSLTKVVMSDKDFTERAVFKKEFPSASLLICLFHTLRSLKREVSCEKLGLLPGERDNALELLTAIAYSGSQQEYEDNYNDLKVSGLKSVIDYFDTNWHPICHQWVECFKGANFTVGERTNNRLESINAKIKSVCSKYASLTTFFDQFFAVLACLRNERDHSTLMALVKKPVLAFPPNSPEVKFAEFLTPYATTYVHKQLVLHARTNIQNDTGIHCEVASSNGLLIVTPNRCQCTFWTSMHLPCRHIFTVREHRHVPLFSTDGVAARWTNDYMREKFANKRDASKCGSSSGVTTIDGQRERSSVLSQHQKFHKAVKLAQEIASLASEVGMVEFRRRYDAMKSLRDAWVNGKEAMVAVLNEEDDNPPKKSPDPHRNSGLSTDDNGGSYNQTADDSAWEDRESSSTTSDCLKNLKVLPVMKKRGRPKGAEKTVIGLPRCKKFKGYQVRKPVAFLRKTTANREEVMLSWFLDCHVKEAVLARKRLVEEEDVEMRPERIPSACLEDDVCIQSIQKYFSNDAWSALTNVLDVLRSNTVWYCGICAKKINDETENSIKCDSCLTWFHFQCTCLKKCPKVKQWFCRHCRSSNS